MNFLQIINKGSLLTALGALLFSWFFFYYHTALFFKSFIVATFCALIVWMTYIAIRIVYLCVRK